LNITLLSCTQLDTDEVVKLLNLLGQEVTTKEAEELIDAVDVDGNRELDFNEFVYAVAGDHDASTRNKMQMAFNMFDVDESGSIDRDELKKVSGVLGAVLTDEEVDQILGAADQDGDGEISIEEFCNLLLESISE
jgi:calmodulin